MLPLSLDTTDWKILAALQEDARISNLELAKKVHLSPSPCLARVRRLEDITRLAAELPPMAPALQGMFARNPGYGRHDHARRPAALDLPSRGARRRHGS